MSTPRLRAAHGESGIDIVERLQAEGWELDPGVDLAADSSDLVLTTGAQLRALTDAFRLRLLAELGRYPGSAKELAARFDVPTTRLYHHLGLLEEHGFIGVVATRRSGARTERCYAARPWQSVRPSAAMLEGDRTELAEALRALAEVSGAALEEAVRSGAMEIPDDDASMATSKHVFSWLTARLTQEQVLTHASALIEVIEAVVEDSAANLRAEQAGEQLDLTRLVLFSTLMPDVVFPTSRVPGNSST